MHYLTVDKFFAGAPAMRKIFDQRFANPLQAHRDRFVWDYWHVPGEYTHLRTPAYTYFAAKLYERFHRQLVRWGREKLGCHDISPPWLSCYVEGCEQRPHRDVPHGPLAFVYSLSFPKKFRGGETWIVRPQTLIKPEFNRLTVFNPALTHGVKRVRGTHDPREGRLVIHGWFVNPRPFWTGPLTVDQVQEGLDGATRSLPQVRQRAASSFAAFRLHIQKSGRVRHVEPLVHTFADSREALRFANALQSARFAPSARGSTVTLPLRFD